MTIMSDFCFGEFFSKKCCMIKSNKAYWSASLIGKMHSSHPSIFSITFGKMCLLHSSDTNNYKNLIKEKCKTETNKRDIILN